MFKSPAKALGELLKNEMSVNSHFYLFSPDETTSNKLDAVYDETERAWSDLKKQSQDLPESESGRIVELLSENVLFATMLGHILSGGPAMMTSYESFFTIITSQIIQHLKFLEQSEQVSWRPEYPAVNLLSTSTCWRQDHNGFSHQSPALISTLLDRPSANNHESANLTLPTDSIEPTDLTHIPGGHANCLFPVDAVAMKEAMSFMMSSKNVVNLVTFNKTDEPVWIDENHAKFQYEHGASIFGFASDGDTFYLDSPENDRFDFIFVAAGDIATREALYAVKILKQDLPDLKIRFINILALTHNAIGTTHHKMSQQIFDQYFRTSSIIANFHGYPDTLKNVLATYVSSDRLSVHGFLEQGSTTTPFEMLTKNHASRFDLALDAVLRLRQFINDSDVVQLDNEGQSIRTVRFDKTVLDNLAEKYRSKIAENHVYAAETGLDLPEIIDFKW